VELYIVGNAETIGLDRPRERINTVRAFVVSCGFMAAILGLALTTSARGQGAAPATMVTVEARLKAMSKVPAPKDLGTWPARNA
jgi:hypothetical protein